MDILLPLIILAALLFWLAMVWTVVNLAEDDFPGRNDKLMWAIIVFFGSVVGAAIFASWVRKIASDKRKRERTEARDAGRPKK